MEVWVSYDVTRWGVSKVEETVNSDVTVVWFTSKAMGSFSLAKSSQVSGAVNSELHHLCL